MPRYAMARLRLSVPLLPLQVRCTMDAHTTLATRRSSHYPHTGIDNPILAAFHLMQEESRGRLSLGRIRPMYGKHSVPAAALGWF
jgi:hypothetical protein